MYEYFSHGPLIVATKKVVRSVGLHNPSRIMVIAYSLQDDGFKLHPVSFEVAQALAPDAMAEFGKKIGDEVP